MKLDNLKLNEIMLKSMVMLEKIGYKIPEDYTWELSSTKKIMGECNYQKRKISVSSYLAEFYGEEEILDTCLHELCHALAPKAGHTGKWKEITKKVNKAYNMDIKRCYTANKAQKEAQVKSAKYVIQCDKCKTIFTRNRKSKFTDAVAKNNGKYYTCSCGGKHFSFVK